MNTSFFNNIVSESSGFGKVPPRSILTNNTDTEAVLEPTTFFDGTGKILPNFIDNPLPTFLANRMLKTDGSGGITVNNALATNRILRSDGSGGITTTNYTTCIVSVSATALTYGTRFTYTRSDGSTFSQDITHSRTITGVFSPTNTLHTIGPLGGLIFRLQTGGSVNSQVTLRTSRPCNMFGQRIHFYSGWQSPVNINFMANGTSSLSLGVQYSATALAISCCIVITQEGSDANAGRQFIFTCARGGGDTTIRTTVTLLGA